MAEHPRANQLGFATRAIHLNYDPASAQGALQPPIYMTSTYAFESVEHGASLFQGEQAGYIYGRRHNPTQTLLEDRVASLEGAEAAVAMASGIACITTAMWSLLDAGDEVVVDQTLYGNSFAFFVRGLPRFNVATHVVDCTDLEALAAAITPKTKLVFFETPANPNLRLIDIAAVARIARAKGVLTVVDNTFCSPALQRPIEFGADLVVHSATKFLGGHGDLLGGVIAGPQALIDKVRNIGLRFLTGATLSPMNAFLILRGLKTLELRMERHSAAAQAVAELLAGHKAVASVSYPGLPSFPQYALAREQMARAGGLVAFELAGGLPAGRRFMNRLELVTRAVSLGDAETLVQHPASMTHATYTAEERAKHGISDGLIRLSIGLETVTDLVADVQQALDAA